MCVLVYGKKKIKVLIKRIKIIKNVYTSVIFLIVLLYTSI